MRVPDSFGVRVRVRVRACVKPPKDYASKGYEYFDVWAPEMATHYGQVFWTDQGNNPIPDAIIKRFANKTMAIMGEY